MRDFSFEPSSSSPSPLHHPLPLPLPGYAAPPPAPPSAGGPPSSDLPPQEALRPGHLWVRSTPEAPLVFTNRAYMHPDTFRQFLPFGKYVPHPRHENRDHDPSCYIVFPTPSHPIHPQAIRREPEASLLSHFYCSSSQLLFSSSTVPLLNSSSPSPAGSASTTSCIPSTLTPTWTATLWP